MRSYCWVCDHCKQHTAAWDAGETVNNMSRPPSGWVTIEQELGVITPTYCSLKCANEAAYPMLAVPANDLVRQYVPKEERVIPEGWLSTDD